jgi:nitrogen regulatory protein PII
MKMKKIISIFLISLLLFTQTIVYAVDVIIEDPTPDLLAPYIKEISVTSNELTPSTPIKVVAVITDELSGFNKGTITYTKPTNQTITVPLLLNSSSGNYEASISVQEKDVAGEWKVSSIYLQDKKENEIYLSHLSTQSNGEKIDFTNLSLNITGVTSPPISTDKEAPVVHSISVSSQQISVNEKIEVKAEITDNESGVSTVRATYKKPNGTYQPIYLYANTEGQFVGSYAIGKYEISGEWMLTSLYMNDKDGNYQSVTSYIDNENNQQDFAHCSITISGTIVDSESPILRDISVVSQEIKANERIEVKATVTDNESGVWYVKVNYKTPSGKNQLLYLQKNELGQYVGSIPINQYEERGERILTNVYLSDAVGNNKTITSYIDSTNSSKDFSHCTVNVSGTTPDWEAPEFTGGSISVQQISTEQAAVKLTIEVNDYLSGITNSSLTGTYRKPSGKYYSLNFSKQSNQYTATIYIDKYDELGEWVLGSLSICDAVGNCSATNKIGISPLSEFNIHVMGKITITPGTHNNLAFEAPEVLTSGQSYQLNPVLRSSNTEVAEIDVSSDALTKYYTSDPELLNVNSTGLLTVPDNAGSGFVILEVSYGEIKKQVQIKINEGSIESYLEVSPLATTLHAGQSEQMKVVEINDGARSNITNSISGITYSSSNPSLVTVTKDGLIQVAFGDITGYADIEITYKNLKAKTTVKVSEPIVKSLSIAPQDESLSLSNNKLQLVVKAFMTDGTTKDVTKGVEGTKYISSNTDIAQVSEDGLITVPLNAINGEVTITAKNNGVSVQSKIKVNVPYLTELQVTPNEVKVLRGEKLSLSVIGIMSNGVTKDLTLGSTGTTYLTSLTSRAAVDENGIITIPEDASYGNATITIKNGVIKTTILLTVEEDITNKFMEIKASVEKNILHRYGETQLNVIGVYGNGAEKDITQAIEGTTYVSSVPSRVMVDENGKISIPPEATYGDATITIRNGSTLRTSVVISVKEDLSNVLTEIKATTEISTFHRNGETHLNVIGVYGNGLEKDITQATEGTTYVSSVPSRVMVDENGEITIPADATYGDATITIRNGSTLRTSIVVSVKEDLSNMLTEMKATTETSTLHRNGETQLNVIGVYGNGSEKEITQGIQGTTYVSSVPSRVMVDENGKISIPPEATYGDATITIKNGLLRTTVVIKIIEDPSQVLTELTASTLNKTLYRDATGQINVTGTYKDGLVADLTGSNKNTTYVSSVPSRVMVDENGLVSIPTSATFGNATITIKNGILKTYLVITVEEDPSKVLVQLNASIENQTLLRGVTEQLKVMGTYKNGDEKDLTNNSEGTTYVSSVPSRAIVDQNGLITIPIGATKGTSTITIRNSGIRTTIVITIP